MNPDAPTAYTYEMSQQPANGLYRFTSTQDWFSHNIASWTNLFPLVRGQKPRVLEVGSWEGRSAVFLLNTICKDGGEIVCIDHFDLFQTAAGQERYSKIKHNLELTGQTYRVLPQFSVPALLQVLTEEMASQSPGFDWIYVDGSHEADDTMLDGELVWRLARKGAVIIFDDYHWNKEPEDSMHHPKRGIDAFLTLHQGEYERLTDTSHYQVVLRKLTSMRIGFLLGGNIDDVTINKALEYGINIALTVDSEYAMGAAVTILSVVENTPGRITVYIVDCGLLTDDKDKLGQTISGYGDRVTMKYLDVPSGGLAEDMGPVWAKLDIINILPVERVLYLDADVLVRRSIRDLWDIDLDGKTLAAAPDVGHPMGHSEVERRPYFNAGVILFDLARARGNTDMLIQTAKSMKDSKFRDQDALNSHFVNDWVSLDLKWNAQGLGTYARYPSNDRNALCLEKMADPEVVHFTGPVHPSLIEILNPYVQPPTAKPWGYVGSPGHPFQNEWWSVLEKTGWKGIKSSEDRKSTLEIKKDMAIKVATQDFMKVFE